ncbi:MAG: hypothetical protein AB1485_03575 [Candidatus Thermoplasmatota archaeon]
MPITTTKEINEVLRNKIKTEKSVRVSNLDGQDCVAVNLAKDVIINVEGKAGDFFAAYNKGATLILKGSAGKEIGYKMGSGNIIIVGDVASIGEFKGGNIFVSGEVKDKTNVKLEDLDENELAQVSNFIKEKEILGSLKKVGIIKKERGRAALGKPATYSLDELLLIKEQFESKGEVDITFKFGNLSFATPVFLAAQAPSSGFAYAGCLANSFSICKSIEEIELVKSNKGVVFAQWPEVESLEDCDAVIVAHENPKALELVRELTYYHKPVIAKIATKNIYEGAKQALAYKPEGIAIDSSYFPVIGAIAPAKRAISELNSDAKLLVFANLKNAEDILKIIALGADAVGLVLEEKAGDWKIVGEVIANMLKKLAIELKAQLIMTGVSSLEELSTENLRALSYNTAAITGVKLLGYERVLPFWEY